MPQKRLLIGIAAPTCAGKTSLVAELERRLSPTPTVYSFDEYDLYPAGSDAIKAELLDPKITNWENPSLFDQQAYINDLQKIKNGRPVRMQARSRESMAKGHSEKTVTPSTINIVEGVFLYLYPEAHDLFDMRFFIDLPISEMVSRRLERSSGGVDPWDKPDYIKNEMVRGTLEYVLPQRDDAHEVLDGLKPTEVLADIVMSQIQTLLGHKS